VIAADTYVPMHENDLDLVGFSKFIGARGGYLLPPENEHELLKAVVNDYVSILHRRKNGRLTWSEELSTAYESWKTGGSTGWSGFINRVNRRVTKKEIMYGLIARDGKNCCYCDNPLDMEKATIEHFLDIAKGGSNHINNLALCCKKCNGRVLAMPVLGKMKLRMSLIMEREYRWPHRN